MEMGCETGLVSRPMTGSVTRGLVNTTRKRVPSGALITFPPSPVLMAKLGVTACPHKKGFPSNYTAVILCTAVACRTAWSWAQPVNQKPLTDHVTRWFAAALCSLK